MLCLTPKHAKFWLGKSPKYHRIMPAKTLLRSFAIILFFYLASNAQKNGFKVTVGPWAIVY